MNTEQERAEFEKWLASRDDKSWLWNTSDAMFLAWRAALAQPVAQPTKLSRSQKLAQAGITRRPSLWALGAREALELIASPRMDREACRQLALETLGRGDVAPAQPVAQPVKANEWQLVPKKVNDAMIDAANSTPTGFAGSPPHWQWVWDRMLAAAPQDQRDLAPASKARTCVSWIPAGEQQPPRRGRFLGFVDGSVRVMSWGKTSHVPLYGYCLADQGAEDFDIAEPSHWMPLPDAPDTQPSSHTERQDEGECE